LVVAVSALGLIAALVVWWCSRGVSGDLNDLERLGARIAALDGALERSDDQELRALRGRLAAELNSTLANRGDHP
jgi:hypothetical protein